METEEHYKKGAYSKDSKCIGVARVGFNNQKIKSGKMSDFLDIDMGPPLHSFIICSEEIHSIEEEMFEFFSKWF